MLRLQHSGIQSTLAILENEKLQLGLWVTDVKLPQIEQASHRSQNQTVHLIWTSQQVLPSRPLHVT